MKIQKVVCSAGKTGFFFDDQKAIKAGAKSDGNFYEGKPVIPEQGFGGGVVGEEKVFEEFFGHGVSFLEDFLLPAAISRSVRSIYILLLPHLIRVRTVFRDLAVVVQIIRNRKNHII